MLETQTGNCLIGMLRRAFIINCARIRIVPMVFYGKLLAGFLFSEKTDFENALRHFATKAGAILRRSACFPFDETDYYAAEMAATLYRQFVSFAGLIALDDVVRWKKWANEVEDSVRVNGNRQVNVDPGYLDMHKIILLSGKAGGHKIYLGQQVWADMALFKERGGYRHFAWTFPDLRTHKYDPWFLQARVDFKNDLNAQAAKQTLPSNVPIEILRQ